MLEINCVSLIKRSKKRTGIKRNLFESLILMNLILNSNVSWICVKKLVFKKIEKSSAKFLTHPRSRINQPALITITLTRILKPWTSRCENSVFIRASHAWVFVSAKIIQKRKTSSVKHVKGSFVCLKNLRWSNTWYSLEKCCSWVYASVFL